MKTPMPLPEIRYCLICEDIRLEKRNLNSFMGVYGATPYVAIRIMNFQLPVGFSLVFMGAPALGKFVIDAELRNPDGTRIDADVRPKHFEFTFSPEMGSSILTFRLMATFGGPNTYTIALVSDGVAFFRDTFQLQQGNPADFQ